MLFPYGKAPLLILLLALVTGVAVFWSHSRYGTTRPDLIIATHARLHADIYEAKLPEFERRHGVKVEVQTVSEVTMRTRLQAAFGMGTEVPDLVEIPQHAAFFLRGPMKDLGFLDLTSWVKETRLDERLVESRFSMWQRRGVIFALPHDVHPVMLAYRADIVEALGIDVSKIETWDDFVTMARTLTRDLNGDGVPDRYALELSADGRDILSILMLQRGVGLFNEAGDVTFDEEGAVDTIMWIVQQLHGPQPTAYDPRDGQPLWRGMMDGLVVFYFTPDWRTRFIEQYVPSLSGKMKLMPLPAWTPGGRRTSTWGATGGAITKATKDPELAKKLLEFLYVEQTDGGKNAAELHILPPARATWTVPAFAEPSPYYSGQKIMQLYAELAPDVPPAYTTPYTPKAEGKRNQAILACSSYYRANGEKGFREFVRAELKRQADTVRKEMARNVLMNQ